MSITDEARAEAERRYPTRLPYNAELEERINLQEGFIDGAEWQASRKVEVTDEMVERGAGALHDRQWRASASHPRWDHCGRFDTDHRTECFDDARASLTAALGGGE